MNKRFLQALLALSVLCLSLLAQAAQPQAPTVVRLVDGPIIEPNMDARMGSNIQGPSLIRVPDWIEQPLGKYYLYFADHRGSYIRLAYADEITGPWQMYEAGSLKLEDSYFPTTCPPCALAAGASGALYAHIASPDVHVDEENQQIVMYLHGRGEGQQSTRLALSSDGIEFEGSPEVLGRPYFRVIEHGGYHYALSMPGYMYRSRDGLSDFQEGPRFFNDNMRHNALLIRDNKLHVFWTQAGHAPERIFLSVIDMTGDWMQWQESEAVEVLRPETEWEGAGLEVAASRRGHIDERVNQLRDPAIFEEGGRTYLLYSVAGEHGIAIAELIFE
ncbi:MAG: hypothetical protein DHS20C12_06930 [Pseudohongiella sp.]|nr:MAG: hypothetical protein DHS20C12_06930 [Pseudohongiella sp.]